MVGYGGHSETAEVLVNNEGLAIPSLLKIQSDPLGNPGDIFGDEYAHATKCYGRNRVAPLSRNSLSIN